MATEVNEIIGINIITEVPTLDDGIPLSDNTKMYVDTEQTFRQIPLSRLFDWLKGQITRLIYPVGSIYMTLAEDNPTNTFGGTWEKIEGKFLLGSSEDYLSGTTGGEASHVLTISEMPSHIHNATAASGGGHTHSGSTSNNGSHSHGASIGTGGAHNHTPSDGNYRFSTNKDISGTGTDVERRHVTAGTGTVYTLTSQNRDSISQVQYTSWNNGHDHGITINNSGGHTHTVSVASGGSHSHNISVTNTGEGNAHNNMPPYQTVNIWKRIA